MSTKLISAAAPALLLTALACDDGGHAAVDGGVADAASIELARQDSIARGDLAIAQDQSPAADITTPGGGQSGTFGPLRTQFDHVPVPAGAMDFPWYEGAKANYTEGVDDPIDWPALYAATPEAQRVVVRGEAELQAALDAAGPGDMILVAAGTYSGVQVTMRRGGEAERPIVLTAEPKALGSAGEVVFEGGHKFMHLFVPSQHVVIGGFKFVGQAAIAFKLETGAVEEPTYSAGPSDIRITDSWFEQIGRARGSNDGVVMVGQRCHRVRVDHNVFIDNYNHVRYRHGKDSRVSATKDGRIDHNYFGPVATEGFLDGVPYEISAMQTCCRHVSETSDHLTFVFEHNVVEMPHSSRRVDNEILEIKTNGAVVRNNIFALTGGQKLGGSISLRYSHHSVVESNYGHGLGIVVHGSHHVIRNNYLDCEGQERHGILMPRWGRRAPENCTDLPRTHANLIDHNTVLDPGHPELNGYGMRIGDDDHWAVRPIYDCTISNNVVKAGEGRLGFFDSSNEPDQTEPRSSRLCDSFGEDDDLGGTNTNITFTRNYFENTGSATVGNVQGLDTVQPPPASEEGLGSSLAP